MVARTEGRDGAAGADVASPLRGFLVRAPRVDANVLCAGLSGYLLLGLLWVVSAVVTDWHCEVDLTDSAKGIGAVVLLLCDFLVAFAQTFTFSNHHHHHF